MKSQFGHQNKSVEGALQKLSVDGTPEIVRQGRIVKVVRRGRIESRPPRANRKSLVENASEISTEGVSEVRRGRVGARESQSEVVPEVAPM